MFEFETMWDVYEFKLFLLFINAVIAIVLGNIIHDRMKDRK